MNLAAENLATDEDVMTLSPQTRNLLDSAIVCDLLVPDAPAAVVPGAGRRFDQHVALFEQHVNFASFTIGLDHTQSIEHQIKACAATGVVVTGVGLFMSKEGQNISADMLIRQIDYLANLVGAAHIGIGLDHIEDLDFLAGVISANANKYPQRVGYIAGDRISH